MGESEQCPPKMVITGKIALGPRERIKKPVSKCSGEKKWEWGSWMRRNRRGVSGKEMCNEGQGKVRNRKATSTGLRRTVC